jgi:inward rectifier potassium channel
MAADSSSGDRGRVLAPSGSINVVQTGARDGYLHDLYHFLLTSSWLRLLVLLATAYVASNSLFALLYLLGGDSIEGARPGSFADAFFFSVQTMATIGFGKLVPRTGFANVLVTVESLVGLLGLALVTGLMFAKFSRPTARVLFSRVAVITQRDGVPCLMFRVANQRGNQIVEARMHVVLATTETTAEGEVIRRLRDLDLLRSQHALFALSWTALHPITEHSPLFRATPASLAAAEVELIVSLTGLDESFSQTVHARHSYVPDEILWGVRFVDILSRTPDGRRQLDYTRFHDVVPADEPR